MSREARLSQIINAGTPWTTTYSYDPWGNLKQKATTGPGEPIIGPFTIDNHNHISAYTYDAAGNLTFDGKDHLNFDAENQIHPVSGLQYYYDGDGHRVAKSDGSRWWYDDAFNAISSADISNTIKRDFIFFNGARIAYVSVSTGDPHYFLTDHLGSPHVIANGSGSVVSWEADYFPYGGEIPISNADNLSLLYLFTGYAYNSETGDYYADFREQSPTLGRFFSPDPVGGDPTNPQSWNRYAYALNDPPNLVDPLGLFISPGYIIIITVSAPAPLDPFSHDPFFLCGMVGLCEGGGPRPIGDGPDRSGGGGNRGSTSKPTPTPDPQQGTCIPKEALQVDTNSTIFTNVALHASRFLAGVLGKTVGIGIGGGGAVGFGGSLGFVGYNGSASFSIASDKNGNSGVILSYSFGGGYLTGKPNANVGGAANIGYQFTLSGQSLEGLASPSGYISGAFENIGLDFNSSTATTTVGLGVGARGGISAIGQPGKLIPICKD